MPPCPATVKRKLASGVKTPLGPILPRDAVLQAGECTKENGDLTYDSRLDQLHERFDDFATKTDERLTRVDVEVSELEGRGALRIESPK